MAARAFPKERSGALGRSHPSKVGRWLAASIVDTIREPLLVLDRNLRVVTANRSFYVKPKWTVTIFKACRLMRLVMANGTFRSCGCCWRKS